MSSGFIRRFSDFPGIEVITAIEGIVIVDLAAPGAIAGIQNGVVGLVGEFADMSSSVAVSASGVVTSSIRPVEIFSPTDMLNKLGSFDETLGEFGDSGGNGYTWISRKSFQRLIAAPINLCSSNGTRAYRELPTNKSATNASEIVPMQAATVSAGAEFRTSGYRIRIGAKVNFSADGAVLSGIDGTVVHTGVPAVTQVFNSATGDFLNKAHVGDVIVMGALGSTGAQLTNAGTYRIQAVNLATQLHLEKLNGATFDFDASSAMTWRLHPGAAADSAPEGNYLAAAAGYRIPARPLDHAIAAGAICAPTVAATAGTASSWDPLSGLKLAIMPGGGGGMAYDSAVQAPNVASGASIQALYQVGLDALAINAYPTSDINIVCTARNDSIIRAAKMTHVLSTSSSGLGRVAINVPELTITSLTDVVGDTDSGSSPGVGANRSDRMIFSWPGVLTYVPEAVGFSILGADGATYDNGQLDVAFDAWFASILSNLAPERNPGQAASPVDAILSTVLGVQRGVTALGMTEYMLMRQKGIAGINVMTRSVQSGITTSLVAGKKNINRRRFADFVEDSVANALVPFNKLPLTRQLRDTATSEIVAFFEQMLSRNNPAAQRIDGYTVDDITPNTADMLAQGIYIIKGGVRMTPTADFIVFQAQIGENVEVSVTVA